jgi:hypothetical protein
MIRTTEDDVSCSSVPLEEVVPSQASRIRTVLKRSRLPVERSLRLAPQGAHVESRDRRGEKGVKAKKWVHESARCPSVGGVPTTYPRT